MAGLLFNVGAGGIGAGASVDQETRTGSRGKDEAGDAGALGNGDLDADAIGESEGVVAGMGLLVAVVKGRGIRGDTGARTGGQLGRDGQDGEIAIERAARAADVGEA